MTQYAAEAYATSEYGGDWAEEEAVGPPSHNEGDCATLKAGSWAPARRDQGTYQLTVSFNSPVRVAEVAVREHANPREAAGFLQRVEAWTQAEAGRGGWAVAWEGDDDTACGFDKVISLLAPTALTSRIRLTSRTDSAAWEYVDAVRVVGCAGEALGAACRRPNHPLVELSPSSRFSELLRRLRLRVGRRERRGAYESAWLRRTRRQRSAVLLRRRPLELR